MEITDIAGDLSGTEVKVRVEEVRSALGSDGEPLIIRGYCNNQKANYTVRVGEFPRNPILWIDKKSEKPIKDYCKKTELPRRIGRNSMYLMHLTQDIADLFPYHHVAFIRKTSLT